MMAGKGETPVHLLETVSAGFIMIAEDRFYWFPAGFDFER